MAIAVENFFLFSVMFATSICMKQVKRFLHFMILCMSYDANASMCYLKQMYPFLILYVVLCNIVLIVVCVG